MNKTLQARALFVLGLIFVALASHYLTRGMLERDVSSAGPVDERGAAEPIYWVAPMDPDYRRDKPGKSPMGMDLVPVYADTASESVAGPGTISVHPTVVNNLGVRTAKTIRAPLQPTIRTVGYVQYDEDRLIHIHPRVEGWIEKLYIKSSGDPVVKGQALYELYSPELVNAQEEYILALSRDNNRLIRAAHERLQALQLSAALVHELRRTRTVKQTITFYAPQDGVVENLEIREGFFVQPGTTLMAIGSLAEVWVEAEIFERQAMLVAVGMPVVMTLDYLPGREWRGVVDYIYPTLNQQTRALRVRLRFDNSDGVLRPNMYTQVVLRGASDTERLLVPREAVIRTGNQDRVVLALGEGRFKSIAVILGRLDEHHAEILDGLAEGDTVVTSAQFLLDSESSKTADFGRLEATVDDAHVHPMKEPHKEESGAHLHD